MSERAAAPYGIRPAVFDTALVVVTGRVNGVPGIGAANADTSDSNDVPQMPDAASFAASTRKSRRECVFFDMRALGFAVKSQRYTRIIAISGPPTRFAAHNPHDGYRGRGLPARINQNRNSADPGCRFGTDLAVPDPL